MVCGRYGDEVQRHQAKRLAKERAQKAAALAATSMLHVVGQPAFGAGPTIGSSHREQPDCVAPHGSAPLRKRQTTFGCLCYIDAALSPHRALRHQTSGRFPYPERLSARASDTGLLGSLVRRPDLSAACLSYAASWRACFSLAMSTGMQAPCEISASIRQARKSCPVEITQKKGGFRHQPI